MLKKRCWIRTSPDWLHRVSVKVTQLVHPDVHGHCCVPNQCLLGNLPRIHRGVIDGAPEQLSVLDQPVSVVEEDDREHFVLQLRQLKAQGYPDIRHIRD